MPKREFNLTPTQPVTLVPTVTIQASAIVIEKFNDDGVQIDALLSFKSPTGETLHLVLWDEANYPQTQPTNTQIRNRIKLLLNLV